MKKIILFSVIILVSCISFSIESFGTVEYNEYLDEITNSEIVSGNRVKLLTSGTETFAQIEKMINEAQETINIEFFIINEDTVGEYFKDLLIKRAEEGIKVRVITDNWHWRKNSEEFKEEVSDNLELRVHNSFVAGTDNINHSYHEKYVIVDGKYGLTGGTNLHDVNVDRYVKKHPFAEPEFMKGNRDANVYIEGPMVAELQKAFVKNWNYLGEDISDDEYLSLFPELKSFEENVKMRFISQDKTRFDTVFIDNLYFYLVQNAQKTLYLETPYFTGPPNFIYEIVKAARRGVDVKIVLNNVNNSDHKFVYDSGTIFYHWLITSGVEIYEFKDIMLHTKIAIVDDEVAVVGSFNLNYRSFLYDGEDVVFIENKDFIRELSDFYEYGVDHSELITLEVWEAKIKK